MNVVLSALRTSVVFVLVAGQIGCTALPAPATRRIRQADLAYRNRRFRIADELLTPVIEAHPNKPEVAEALYLRGLCRLQTHRSTEARGDLRRALAVAKRNEVTDRAHTQLGNMAYDSEQYDQAVTHYEQVYDELPDTPPKDRVGYQYGIALQRIGRLPDGGALLGDVARSFPGSPFAAKARRKSAWPYTYFAIQCGAFGRIAGAHRRANVLKGRGIDAVAVPDPERSPNRYLVHVGRYRTFAAAQRCLPAIRQVQSDAFIVP